jgi:hypothetical protein
LNGCDLCSSSERLKDSGDVHNYQGFTTWLADTDHEQFFDLLLTRWKEAKRVPLETVIEEEVMKIGLNPTLKEDEAGFDLRSRAFGILLRHDVTDPDNYWTKKNSTSLIWHYNNLLQYPPVGTVLEPDVNLGDHVVNKKTIPILV